MREDIKERIELIKKGCLPVGYKLINKVVLAWEFDCYKLGQIFEFQNGINAEKQQFGRGIKIVGVSDVLSEHYIDYSSIKNSVDITNEQLENYSVNYGDILFQRSSESVDDVGSVNVYLDKTRVATFGGFVIRGKRKIDLNPIVLNEVLKMDYVRRQCMRYAAGVQHINIGQEALKKIWISFPGEYEQKNIEKILSLYLRQQLNVKNMIEYKQKQKTWLMQNLVMGKRRLCNYTNEWEYVQLKDIITEENEKTKQQNEYDILSVTKSGICLQSEQFNKQIASENNIGYKVVKKGNLVFSTMNLWMGSLDVLDKYDKGIVSPAYKVFSFQENKMLPEFGKYYMKTAYMIWLYNMNSEQGASTVRKNLDLNSLLKTEVKIPSVKEQETISKIMEMADKEIELLKAKQDMIKREKKAMMQLLLTGIVRGNEI
ncbi:MAG: restriction endonuclease subunit S [Lachnospiraceae bacterium]|nr:restriction endonuclease subunit S [Lachnospiraceae bacterium]